MQLVSLSPFSGPPDPFTGLAHVATGLTRRFVLVVAGALAGRALAPRCARASALDVGARRPDGRAAVL